MEKGKIMQYTFKLNKTWTALTIILFISITLIMYFNGSSGDDILRVLALVFVMFFFVMGSAFWIVFLISWVITLSKKEK